MPRRTFQFERHQLRLNGSSPEAGECCRHAVRGRTARMRAVRCRAAATSPRFLADGDISPPMSLFGGAAGQPISAPDDGGGHTRPPVGRSRRSEADIARRSGRPAEQSGPGASRLLFRAVLLL